MKLKMRLVAVIAALLFFVPFSVSVSASAAADNFTATIVRNCADNSFDVTFDPSFVIGFEAEISTTSGGSPVLVFGSNPTTGMAHFEPGPYYDTIVLNVTFGDGDVTVRSFAALVGTCGGVGVTVGGSVDPEPVVVTPLPPTLVDPQVCGVAFAVAVPSVEGVVYSQDQFATIVTITATAADGYALADGAETSWSFDVAAVDCPSTEPTPDDPGKAGPTPTPGVEVTPTAPAGGGTDDGGGTVDDGTDGTDDGTTGGNTGGTDGSSGGVGNDGTSSGDSGNTGTSTGDSASANTSTGTTGNVTTLPTAGSGPGGDDTLAWAAVAAAVVLGVCSGGLKWHGRRA